MNKFSISIENCHTVNELKLVVSGLYSSLFIKLPLIFHKNFGGGGKTEESRHSFLFYTDSIKVLLSHKIKITENNME